jgi:hypothetical protein
MARIRPESLILRCYGHKTSKGNWVGVCLDFNLAVEADSPQLLKEKMGEVILSYLETVIDTQDAASIPKLLTRRAPLKDWLLYHFIGLLAFMRRLRGLFVFQQVIPFHLAHSC